MAENESTSEAQPAANIKTPAREPLDARKLANNLAFADALAQEASDTIEAMLTAALSAMQADALGSLTNVRRLMLHCRTLAGNLSNDINCLAEECGVNHIDEREREFDAQLAALRSIVRTA